jgi:hypothetical protein
VSAGARIAIGVVSAFAAACFVPIGYLLGPDLPAGAWPFYGLAAFWAIVASACLTPRSRPLTLRLIGAAVCGLSGVNAYSSFGTDDFPRALEGWIVFGLPSAYVAVLGGYPWWGHFAALFNGSTVPQDEASPPEEFGPEAKGEPGGAECEV